jgi:gliding motility-associated lipoprotein GldH
MKIKNSILFILLFLLVISCDKKRVFDQYKSVGNAWHKDSIVTFDLPKLDPKKTFNLYVNVRDNDNYPFNNLFLIVSLEQPNHQVKVDTLEYQMTNPDGTLLGDGFSDIKESKLFYKDKVTFTQKGIYKIHIRHATRQTGKIEGVTSLPGISDVGFRIESTE